MNTNDFNLTNLTTTFTNVTLINRTYPQMTLDLILYGSFFYIVIFIIGVTGNLLVIYVLMKEKELRNFTNYLLANLSLADLMVLFTCVPSGLHDLFAKERWYLGKIMCYSIAFVENCMGFASILSIFFITCDRFYVICKPLTVKAVMTSSRTFKLIVLIWVVSISVNLPYIFLTEYYLDRFADNAKLEYRCNAKSRKNWTFSYIISTAFFVYVIIGIVLVYMYYRISKHLNKSNQFLADQPSNKPLAKSEKNSNNNNSECFENGSGVNLNKRGKRKTILSRFNSFHAKNNPIQVDKQVKQRKKVIFMLMCVIVVFYVCLFPLKIWNLGMKNLFLNYYIKHLKSNLI